MPPKGVSRSVNIVGPSSDRRSRSSINRPRIQTLGLQKIAAEKKRVAEEYENLVQGLSARSRRILAEMRRDPVEVAPDGMEEAQNIMVTTDEDDATMGWENVQAEPSKSDYNEETIAAALRDLLESREGYRKYKDRRTWRQRVENMDARWREIMPGVFTAYLAWMYDVQPEPDSSPEAPHPAFDPPRASDSPPQSPSAPPQSGTQRIDPNPAPSDYDLELECIDYFTCEKSIIVPRTSHQRPAEALVLHGYLSASPDKPTIAVSLKTLGLFHDIRRFKASYSVEAFTRMVCYKYVIPYRRRYRKAISDAFDVYLTLMEHLHAKVQAALGRDAPNWRPRWGCPPCSYKVEGEEKPVAERMIVMDGNNSLKRVRPLGGRKVGDTRTFDSDYYITREKVDKFANEVKSKQSQPHVSVPLANDGDELSDNGGDDGEEGDPTDGAPATACASNWKAAASDEKKRMWAIFEETGVFAAACRHGHVLWLIDMIRSGELAKYPLAMTDEIIREIAEAIILAFDIGCTFKVTLKNSSLGAAFEALGGRVCVNAFHGYSHSYPCQLENHPNVILGIGIEDLETLERLFSSSNQLANVIRYASAYRRMLLIHTFFRHWDEEKYNNLDFMLYNNYVQALDILQNKKPILQESMSALGLTHDKLTVLEREERQYFQNLRDETPWDVHAIAYVETLQDLRAAREELGVADDRFLGAVPDNYQWSAPHSGPTSYAGDTSATRKLETRRRELEERVRRLTSQAIAFELQLGLRRRWQPEDTEYKETQKYIATRDYQRALGRLQRLVIQRLFELHKLNLSQTAYRMRTHIAKSLQKRCKAIRTAVKQYNAAAAALDPPRPALDWDKVSHFSFLEEFTLLQDTRNDLRSKQWAQPLIRETMRTARRITRAEEELKNVNREARRLHTSIADEDQLFSDVLSKLEARKDPMHGPVQEYCARRRCSNAHNLAFLLRLYSLEGFTGIPSPGKHSGPPRERWTSSSPAEEALPEEPEAQAPTSHMDVSPPSPSPMSAVALSSTAVALLDADEHSDIGAEEEDEVGDVTELYDHLSSIAAVM